MKDLNEVEKYIEKYQQKLCSNLATEVADELTKETELSINAFYLDYDPQYYNRHYYNFLKNSFKRHYINSHYKRYSGGVDLTPMAMDDIYQDSIEEVFDTVYYGFHGPSSMFRNPYSFTVTPIMSPSPIERIINKRDEIANNIDKYIDLAKNKI